MASEANRRVVIDDTNPNVVYSANPVWFIDDTGIKDDVGNFGKTFNTTLHGTNVNGTFSFSFTGTGIEVFGTNDIRNSSGVIDPLWNCYVDDVKIPHSSPFQYPENNWLMCGIDSLADTAHTFTLKVFTYNQTFWFDYLLYKPSPSVVLDESVIHVPYSDPALLYDQSWLPLGNFWNMTRTTNSSMSFQFAGTNLSWYGIYPKELPTKPAIASYTVDGGRENTFPLQGLSPGSATAYNQLLFQTGLYPNGLHTLTVKFMGDNTTSPLSLGYLLVQGGGSANGTASQGPIATLRSGQDTSPAPVGIAGLVCAVIAVVVAAVVSVLFYLRYRKKKRDQVDTIPTTAVPMSNPPTATSNKTHFDLASSSPHLGVGVGSREDHSRRLAWHDRFFAMPGRRPPLGTVVANGSDPGGQNQQERRPHILSRWTLLKSLAVHRPVPETDAIPSPYRQGPSQGLATFGRPDATAVADHDHSMPSPSLSLPSASLPPPSQTSGDRSYYGGYRTKREMMELEEIERRR